VKEECKLHMFENRIHRKIFGSKKSEVREQFMIVHNEELNESYRLLRY
jgi:hypothetical protein